MNQNGSNTAVESPETFEDDSDQTTSEDGFGDKLPPTCPHKQTGSMMRAKTCFAMIQDQQFKCALTGIDLTPETASLDHIIPVANGGHPTDARNGHFVHRAINQMKGIMSVEELIGWAKAIITHQGIT